MSDTDPFSALFQVLSHGNDLPGRVLFIGAVPGSGLDSLSRNSVLVQPLQPYAATLAAQGWKAVPEIPDHDEFDQVAILVSKNHDETRFAMARGFERLAAGGLFTVAGANDSGGKRIGKDFAALELISSSTSKHKSRVVQARKESGITPAAVQEWIARGDWQPILQAL